MGEMKWNMSWGKNEVGQVAEEWDYIDTTALYVDCLCYFNRKWWMLLGRVLSESQQLNTLSKKGTSKHLFLYFSWPQIGDSSQLLEGPNSTWKDQDRNIWVQMNKEIPSR